ncbi:MAG: hypothetical protein LRY71_18330 [Bacillaceae bacterium]|nr:hypothetical protein [Bacillaceae bacterium]
MGNEIKISQYDLVQKSAATGTIPATVLAGSAVAIIKESIRCLTDYSKCREQEITERKRIAQQLKGFTEAIKAHKEFFTDSLANNQIKMEQAYDLANKVMKEALEQGNTEMVKETFNFIIAISQESAKEAEQIVDSFSKGNGGTLFIK